MDESISSHKTSSSVHAKEALVEIDYSNLHEDLKVLYFESLYTLKSPNLRCNFHVKYHIFIHETHTEISHRLSEQGALSEEEIKIKMNTLQQRLNEQ